MVENILNNYGYKESGTDDLLMPHALNEDNTIGYGKNTTSKTEGSWPFDQQPQPNGSTPMGTLDIMSFYKKEPTPPTPSGEYMYFEAAEANSTVSMISMLETAPDLEYSTDGVTWQEWQHITADGVHTFDTLTLSAIGDRVYLRGENPNGLGNIDFEQGIFETSSFLLTGKMNSGGNIMYLIASDGEETIVPDGAFAMLFANETPDPFQDSSLFSAPDLSKITHIGNFGMYSTFSYQCYLSGVSDFENLAEIAMYALSGCFGGCYSLANAVDMPNVTSFGFASITQMYECCSFKMTENGSDFNFAFPSFPVVMGDGEQSVTFSDAESLSTNEMGFYNPLGFGYAVLRTNYGYSDAMITVDGEENSIYVKDCEGQASTTFEATAEVPQGSTFGEWKMLENGHWVFLSSDNPANITVQSDKLLVITRTFQ